MKHSILIPRAMLFIYVVGYVYDTLTLCILIRISVSVTFWVTSLLLRLVLQMLAHYIAVMAIILLEFPLAQFKIVSSTVFKVLIKCIFQGSNKE